MLKKYIALFMACLAAINMLFSVVCVNAEEAEKDTESFVNIVNESSYRKYLSCLDLSLKSQEINLTVDKSCVQIKNGDALFTDGGLLFKSENSSADIVFDVPQNANYRIELQYIPVADSNFGNSIIGIKLNGEYPFDEAKELELNWRWRNGEVSADDRGNEILASMTCICEKTVSSLCDPSGRQNEPLLFFLKKGKNTVSVIARTGNFILVGIRLYDEDKPSSYKDVMDEHETGNIDETSNENILLEAEDYSEASSTTLSPDYDKGSVQTSPNSPQKLLYNYIPAEKYTSSGQWLEWQFTPEISGFYNISMRVRQNTKSGFSVVRRLYVNDEIPFEECSELRFDYAGDWYITTLGNGEESYKFYFEAGKVYTLRLEVTSGSLTEITNRVDDLVYELNSLSRSVIMIVGNDPDKYRDYQLDKVIPEFDETVEYLLSEMNTVVSELEKINSGRSGSTLSSFHSLINRLENIKKDPDLLARTLSSFKSDIQGLSAWNQEAKEQPLDLDYICVHSSNVILKEKTVFFKQLWFDLQRILSSFAEDYGIVGNIYEEESSLEVWMTSGRDQMNIVKRLIDNSFSEEYGINVNVSLVTVDIRSAILAGTAPDLSLFLSGDMPVNLALRGSLVDLTQFDDFKAVESRFEHHSILPFTYNGGCYALPLSETFNMMFVRTDIFDELELAIPQTWEEFYTVSTILQRNNLEVGIPSNIGMFATLLFQNGGAFYNGELDATDFGSDAAIKAFDTWTGLFAQYGFPLTYDFYNRFSSGEMPLAIIDYTQYLKIKAASPELSGRWEMCMIPGVENDDGKIDRTLSISAATGGDTSPGLAQSVTSAAIFSSSKHKEDAWKFISWFTSDDNQGRYGREIEDALGSISRYTSANINAFKALPWSIEERELLEDQRGCIKAINEISGNYSVTRELISAFRKVVYENANPTDTIYTYNKKINKELERKNND